MKRSIILIILLGFYMSSFSQEAEEGERYIPETNPGVIEKISQWKCIQKSLLKHVDKKPDYFLS